MADGHECAPAHDPAGAASGALLAVRIVRHGVPEDLAAHFVLTPGRAARLSWVSGHLPWTGPGKVMEVDYAAGFGEASRDVAESLRLAEKLLVAHTYQSRGFDGRGDLSPGGRHGADRAVAQGADMSGVEQAVEAAILAAIASDADVSASLGDPLRIADLASPQPAYPYLEVVRRQGEPSNSAGCEGWVVTIDLAVTAREEGGGLARSVVAEVRSTLRDADLPMDSWHCVVLTPVFTDTLRQAIGRWCSILRLGAIVEAAD